MKYLAIDYGVKRVGIAASDAGGLMSFARCALLREEKKEFFSILSDLLEEEQADAIVIGLPKHLDGTESLTTRQVINFADSLRRRVSIPLYLMEEYLSSAEAESMLKAAGYGLGQNARAKGNMRKAEKERGRIDSLAAARILESFLSLPEEEKRARAYAPPANESARQTGG